MTKQDHTRRTTGTKSFFPSHLSQREGSQLLSPCPLGVTVTTPITSAKFNLKHFSSLFTKTTALRNTDTVRNRDQRWWERDSPKVTEIGHGKAWTWDQNSVHMLPTVVPSLLTQEEEFCTDTVPCTVVKTPKTCGTGRNLGSYPTSLLRYRWRS